MANRCHRDEMLKHLSILDFLLLDLGLYLNVNPCDSRALAIHNKASNDALNLRNAYEKKYGPLRMECSSQTDRWLWTETPWPWEIEANFNL